MAKDSADLFDISTVAARDTFDSMLVNGDDSPLLDAAGKQLSITIYGPGSEQYAAAQAARNQRLMTRMAKRGSKAMLTREEQDAENAEFLASCTASLNGFAYEGRTDRAGVVALYSNHRLGFIAEKVNRDMGDWANFTRPLPTN